MTGPRRCLWLYDGDHAGHPFIRLAAETMASWGWEVTVADRSRNVLSGTYAHRAGAAGSGAVRRFSQLLRQAAATRADTVIATLPFAGLAGRLAHPRAHLVYWPFELLGEQPGPVSAPVMALERWLLRHAVDALITQNDCRARVYTEERGARVAPEIVHNFKPPRVRPDADDALRRAIGAAPADRIVLYEGMLVDGRWLDRLVEAVPLLPADAHLVFLGPPSDWWTTTMLPRIAASAARARIHVLPPVPHDHLPRLVVGADCGVIIYDDRVRNNVFCEPGKLSDYLHAGVPVAAPAFPTIAPLVETHGLGACFADGTPTAIAAAVSHVLATGRESYAPRLTAASARLTWASQEPALRRALRA